MNKFKIEITSVPDRENLVAEIWFEENHIAEINKESDKVNIEIYPAEKRTFDLEEFLNVLETARKKLLG